MYKVYGYCVSFGVISRPTSSSREFDGVFYEGSWC